MDELSTLASQYFTEIPDMEKRKEVIRDLTGVGVTKPFFKNVHIPNTAQEAVSWITYRFKQGNPVIMFGTFGMGKTQIISQVARSLGYRLETLSTSTKLPEDFGGIPLTLEQDPTDDQFRGYVAAEIRRQKLEEAVDAELDKLNRPVTSRKIYRERLMAKLEPTIKVSDDEIDARMKNGQKQKRLEQRMSAPQWVFDAMDAWAMKKQKTVLFFDEINHADQKTLCTLFDLVQAKRFGNRSEYSFEDAVVFAAAGNFTRDNPFIEPLSQPLIDRFKFILYYPGDWGASIQWVKDAYLDMADQFPQLAKLLSDSSVTNSVWSQIFPSPRAVEDFVQGLSEFEAMASEEGPDALADITSLDAIGLSQRNADTTLGKAVVRFLADIGVPKYAQEKARFTAPGASTLDKSKIAKTQIDKIWKKVAAGVSFPIGQGKEVDNSPEGMKLFFDFCKQKLGPLFSKDILASISSLPESNGKVKTLLDGFREYGLM